MTCEEVADRVVELEKQLDKARFLARMFFHVAHNLAPLPDRDRELLRDHPWLAQEEK